MTTVNGFILRLRTRFYSYLSILIPALIALGLAVMAPAAGGVSREAGSSHGPVIGPRCAIVPSTPIGVPAGGSVSFRASNCGTGAVTWRLSGPGTLDDYGTYTAPASVKVQDQSRGCQSLPNNSPFTVPVDQLPVDVHSARWLTRIAQSGPQYLQTYHGLKFYPQFLGLYDNVVDDTAVQQTMHFYYAGRSTGFQDASFPIPAGRDLLMEGGASIDAMGGPDRHLFTVNKDTCERTEVYNLYVDFRSVSLAAGNPTRVAWTTNSRWAMPQYYQVTISGATGAWSAANGTWRMTVLGQNSGTLPFDSSSWGLAPSGAKMTSLPGGYACPTCNSQSGQKYGPHSYAMLGGVDAASMPVGALSLKLEEWYAATRAGRSDMGHALRTTLGNWYLSARYIWPAAGYALSQDIITAATNGINPTFTAMFDINQQYYYPCDNYTWTAGCRFHVFISGFTGAWSGANGDQEAVAVDNYHFTVPTLNTTTWGAMPRGGVFVPDYMPYGATIRLKASFDVNRVCTSTDLNDWCPYAKVYLNTLKKYGMVVADGTSPSDNWDSTTIASEFHPKVLVDASNNIRHSAALQPIEPYLEVVNRASQQVSSNLNNYMLTTVNRTVVTVCGDAGCASNDVSLLGTTIGTDRERLTIAAGVSYPMKVWVNGNVNEHLAFSMDSGIVGAYVSSSGVVTMPNCPAKQRGMVTVTSPSDPEALPLYVDVTCLPRSPDGSYRLAMGNYSGDYVDSRGMTWWGSWGSTGFDNAYPMPGLGWGEQLGTWQGNSSCANDPWTGTDSQLYSRSIGVREDTRVEVILPNGLYNVVLYGEPGFGGYGSNRTCGNQANRNVYDLQVQGQTVRSWLDGYVLAGNQPYRGYTVTSPAAVFDKTLTLVGRIRVSSTYGMSWSSLLIKPSTPSHIPPGQRRPN